MRARAWARARARAVVSRRELVTPWFLDEAREGLRALAHRGARIGTARPASGPTLAAIGPMHREIADFAAGCTRDGDVPVSIAGDCCAAIPVVAGLQRAGIDPLLVWLDAHGDFNTPASSPSGFLGGMPLAMLTGRGDTALLDAAGGRALADERVHLADARDLDPEEAKMLGSSGVHRTRSLEALPAALPRGAAVHVHLDCDVIDSAEVPAQAYPVPGGPSAAAVSRCLVALAAHVDIVGVSVCTWHPGLDTDGESARLCLDCLDALPAGSAG